MRIVILILCCVFLVSCGKSPQTMQVLKNPVPSPEVTPTPQPKMTQIPSAKSEKQDGLLDYRFGPSHRPGRARSQFRAIVKLGSLTEAEFRQTAVDLCKKRPGASSFLVQFFSDASCLEQWDGTGGLRDSDWPYWLCRVSVDKNTSGRLYARTFKLAVDENTGQERTDVLKK